MAVSHSWEGVWTLGTDQSPDGHLTQAAWTVLLNTDRQNLSQGSNYL